MYTIPQYVRQASEKWGDSKVAMRHKNFGLWNEYTWKDYYQEVKYAALGLIDLGLEPEDRIAIIGDAEPWWFWAEIATQAARGIPIGLYVDAQHAEIKYFLEHMNCKFVFSHDQEQVDKVLALKPEVTWLKRAIYWDPKGLQHYDDPLLLSWEGLKSLGREYEEAHPGSFEQLLEASRLEEICYVAPTSGTTGEYSKGAAHTHENYVRAFEAVATRMNMQEGDEYMGILPPAVAWEQIMVIVAGPVKGIIVSFPEEPEIAQHDMREIGPQYMLYGGTLWDSLASMVQARIADANFLTQWLYERMLRLGMRIVVKQQETGRINIFDKLVRGLTQLLVFTPLRDKLGLLKVKNAFNSATLLSPESFNFFHAIGIHLGQGYGSMEMNFTAVSEQDDFKVDTVGPPLPGVEARLSTDGQLLVRSPYLLKYYYNDPEKTKAAFDDGWFCTGDVCNITEAGRIVYYDRMIDVAKLSTGFTYSPIYIESKLRFGPYVKTAMVVGVNQPYVSALINMDYETVGRWAEKHGIPYTTFADLSQKDEVAGLILKAIEGVNLTLPEHACIKKFVLLHKELDPDEAELTRTWKVRRHFVQERYAELINAIYDDIPEIFMESEVKYRDGRTAKTATAVKIRTV